MEGSMKRYLVTLGSETSAGGKVTSASSLRTINGATVALEGDIVHCSRCHADGVIKPDGPRLKDLYNGRHYALQDDLCLCHCSPPPRLLASQHLVCQTLEDPG
jgi:uncharacterized Zn-binding protein involved in type VI secretion